MSYYIMLMLKGVLSTLLTVAVAAILPLVLGSLLSLLVKKVKAAGTVFSWLNIFCEALSVPVLLLLLCYYIALPLGVGMRNLSMVATLVLAFLWYMPAKYNPSFSCIKNILYNGLGLIYNLFQWSLVGFVVGGNGVLQAAMNWRSRTYETYPILIAFVIMALILGFIALLRAAVKQFIK